MCCEEGGWREGGQVETHWNGICEREIEFMPKTENEFRVFWMLYG